MGFTSRLACQTDAMHQQLIRDGLLVILARHYDKDPMAFMALSPEFLDSALAREVVAQLRNDGHIEEEVRGMIRLTARGHMACKKDPALQVYAAPSFDW
jgi:hypothetical protein